MAIGSNEQYAAGPFQANDLIVNNQAMFSNPGMMALVAKEARKGIGGFFEIPNRERKEAPFLTAAKERVNQELGLSPAVQGGMKNFLGESETVEDAPKKWQSSPDSPETELAYITDQEKDLLLKANLHDSLGDGMPNQGPSGIISLDGMGQEDDDSPGKKSYSSGNQGRGAGQTRQSSYDTGISSYDQDKGGYDASVFQKQEKMEEGYDKPSAAIEQAIQDTNARTAIDTDPIIKKETILDKMNKIDELTKEEKEKFNALDLKLNKDGLNVDEQAIYDMLYEKQLSFTDDFDYVSTKEDKTTDAKITDIAKKLGITVKEFLENPAKYAGEAIKKGFDLSGLSLAGSVVKGILDKLKYPTEKSFQDQNYQAIMYDKYFDPKTGDFKNEDLADDFKRFTKDYQGLFEGSGGMNPNKDILSIQDLFKQGYDQGVTPGSDLQRRLDPSQYYQSKEDGGSGLSAPTTMGGLEELGKLNAQDFAGNADFQNKIFAARESTRDKGGNNNNQYQGYAGPVVEKDNLANQTFQVQPEAPVIDPAVGTRPFATPAAGGTQYKLPMDYRAALTRDGEYGINTDPKSIAYSGGFNQMEDMDEYLQRIGKKRKNYLDADGNPIMTNAMGGL